MRVERLQATGGGRGAPIVVDGFERDLPRDDVPILVAKVRGFELQALTSNYVVEQALIGMIDDLSTEFDSHVITLKAGIRFGLDDAFREVVEALNADPAKRKSRLSVILETTGGYVEVAERIYAVCRRYYTLVDFYIPNYAYSAGTVLALSGDDIYMDYYSVLGPIDPQYATEGGEYVPGMGYLAKYNELVKTINTPRKVGENLTYDAEVAFLLKKFDPAKLFMIQQSVRHAESLLRSWLPKHKFKDWTLTGDRKTAVTEQMREERASNIAKVLGDAEKWNSHGRGIGMADLAGDDIKLQVRDFDTLADKGRNLRAYYGLLIDFCARMKAQDAIHSTLGLRRI